MAGKNFKKILIISTLVGSVISSEAKYHTKRAAFGRNNSQNVASLKSSEQTTTADIDALCFKDDIDAIEYIRAIKMAGETEQELSKFYSYFIKNYQESNERAEVYYYQSEILFNDSKYNKAADKLKKIIKTYPSSNFFVPAIEKLYQISEQFSKTGFILRSVNRDKSIEFLNFIVDNVPGSIYAINSLREISKLKLKQKKYFDAIESLERILDEYSGYKQLAEVYIDLANIYKSMVKGHKHNQGGIEKAIQYYNEFKQTFPEHEKIAFVNEDLNALYQQLADSKIENGDFFFYKRNNPKAALICYQDAVDSIPENPSTAIAQQKIQDINDGALPPKRKIDYLLGKPKPASMRDYIQESKVDDREADQFVGRNDRDLPADKIGEFISPEDIHVDNCEQSDGCELNKDTAQELALETNLHDADADIKKKTIKSRKHKNNHQSSASNTIKSTVSHKKFRAKHGK